jgi:mono/diheme cytochrome c family protein
MKIPRALIIFAVLIALCLACRKPLDMFLATAAVAQSSHPAVDSETWAKDVAPVLYKNCTTCHHSGGGGPFSLLTYAEARRWAPQLVIVTKSRFMPPWLPEPGHGDFADVRRLSDHDVDLFQRWVKSGMPQGNLAQAPAPPSYDATWQLGKPDLILKVAKPFALNAGGADAFRNFILP